MCTAARGAGFHPNSTISSHPLQHTALSPLLTCSCAASKPATEQGGALSSDQSGPRTSTPGKFIIRAANVSKLGSEVNAVPGALAGAASWLVRAACPGVATEGIASIGGGDGMRCTARRVRRRPLWRLREYLQLRLHSTGRTGKRELRLQIPIPLTQSEGMGLDVGQMLLSPIMLGKCQSGSAPGLT